MQILALKGYSQVYLVSNCSGLCGVRTGLGTTLTTCSSPLFRWSNSSPSWVTNFDRSCQRKSLWDVFLCKRYWPRMIRTCQWERLSTCHRSPVWSWSKRWQTVNFRRSLRVPGKKIWHFKYPPGSRGLNFVSVYRAACGIRLKFEILATIENPLSSVVDAIYTFLRFPFWTPNNWVSWRETDFNSTAPNLKSPSRVSLPAIYMAHSRLVSTVI